jgi:hypothetical protein
MSNVARLFEKVDDPCFIGCELSFVFVGSSNAVFRVHAIDFTSYCFYDTSQ